MSIGRFTTPFVDSNDLYDPTNIIKFFIGSREKVSLFHRLKVHEVKLQIS